MERKECNASQRLQTPNPPPPTTTTEKNFQPNKNSSEDNNHKCDGYKVRRRKKRRAGLDKASLTEHIATVSPNPLNRTKMAPSKTKSL